MSGEQSEFAELAKLESSQSLPDLAAHLQRVFPALGLADRVAELRRATTGRVVFTTSFGIEDQAIAHAIFSRGFAIDVVTLDTGRLFPQTYDVWAATEQRYGVTIRAYYPDHLRLEALVSDQGIDGFRESVAARQVCCGVRKVAPLQRALSGASAWITGLRADQSSTRADTDFATLDRARKLIKISPLADWSREQVTADVRANGVPYNVLHDRGFLSIGCAPCTRAVAPGESERAGRWWWEQDVKKECGLHNNPRRAAALATAEG